MLYNSAVPVTAAKGVRPSRTYGACFQGAPEELCPHGGTMSLISEYALRRAFRPSVRAKLWRRLAARAALGLPVWDAIEDARGRAEGKNPGFARACGRLLLARDSGLGLADGLGGLGAPGEGLLLSAGESAGRTAEGLSLAAELLETRGRVAKEVKSGLAYPVFLVLLSVIVLVLTSGLIVPQLAAVLDPESWTGAAAWLYALSGFLNSSRGLFLGLVLILLIILTVTSLGTWTGALRQRLDAFGPWKLHALSEGSAFLFTLATLSRAGVQTRVVLETCLASPSSSPWLRERLRGVLRVYGNGTNLGDALAGAGPSFLPEEAIEDLRALDGLDGCGERLLETARAEIREGTERVHDSMRALGTFLLLLVFGLVLLILAGVFSFQQQFASAM